MSAARPLLRLLHLASPALPIGSFHFSQGLEYAIESGWVRDEATALEWIRGLALHAHGTLDLPIYLRLHAAWSRNDLEAVQRWDRRLIAARESQELRAEDRHLGAAMWRILVQLDAVPRSAQPAPVQSYAGAFARACVHYEVAAFDSLQAFAWTWAENQVLAAIKLVPLGHTAGQRMLDALIASLEQATQAATGMMDETIGTCAVMQVIASARHECQYTRLFRS